MAQETLISPGVLTRENDQSQITAGTITAGLALIGPTVTGPVNIPTLVSSYSQFKNKFGGMFTSGGANYEFLTSIAAKNYFQQGGSTILVNRVTSTEYTPATSSIIPNSIVTGTNSSATTTMVFTDDMFNTDKKSIYIPVAFTNTGLGGSIQRFYISAATNNYYNYVGGTLYASVDAYGAGYTADDFGVAAANYINNTAGLNSVLSASYDLTTNIFSITGSAGNTGINGLTMYGGDFYYNSVNIWPSSSVFSGASVSGVSVPTFVLETLNTGVTMDNDGTILSDGSLSEGTDTNVRWEVTNADTSSGTFTLLIRRGDDNTSGKIALETFTNVSLDPNQSNYLEAVVGNQTKILNKDADGSFYIQVSGDYPNNSNYVRVKTVNYTTPNYFDNSGVAKNEYTASIPVNGSGSAGGAFGGASGNDINTVTNLFTDINFTTQGLTANAYATASDLLANKDEYDFTLLATPGLVGSIHSSAVNDFITLAEERGDCFYIVDLVPYNSTLSTAVNTAASSDTNYAGAYWPWVQVVSQETGKLVWVPASTMMPGVYAFNDNVSAEWFAPAGLNRGGLGNVLQAERKLSPANRDTLYAGKVNPIATFPNIGIAAFGQKTLQKKASALDRINVRRLLINLKRYIGRIAKNLVFEQNTSVTRNAFLTQVNPYLESVQQRQGLYAFRVVMDESNNTPDVIDRNQLVGQIYLQPTRTAEFILLDFNILPTGATFGQ